MVYDEGFEVRFSNYTFFAFSKFGLPANGDEKQSVSKCAETQVGWYKTSNNKYGCYYAKKQPSTNGVALLEEISTTMSLQADNLFNQQELERRSAQDDDETVLTPTALLHRAS
jgi:hypothetical protein